MKKIVLYLALFMMSMQPLVAQQGSLLKDINVTSTNSGSAPSGFTQINGVSYFAADDGVHGRELWKTDGSTAGTVLVSDVVAGANSSNPEQFTNVNGTIFFVTSSSDRVHSLWKTNGTAATTTKIRDFTQSYNIQRLIGMNGTLYFGVYKRDGSMQLWRCNGSSAGTQLLKTFAQTDSFSPVPVNGQLYFSAFDGISSNAVWKSNGTPEGTVLVIDPAIDKGFKFRASISSIGNFIYYRAIDNISRKELLVRSDGTSQGTTVIKELGFVFSPTNFTRVNDVLYFLILVPAEVEEVFVQQLWRSDGTTEGTYAVKTLQRYTETEIYFHDLIAANGSFYFIPSEFAEIWKSDGTAAGTQPITNFNPRATQTLIENLIPVGNNLYFTASDGQSGREVWKMDLTTQATNLAYDITPNGSTSFIFYGIRALNNQLLIPADNGMYGMELFTYQEATPAQTTIRINAGGPDFTTATKKLFIADKYYAGIDRTSSILSGDILNTTNDVLYRSGRCSPSFSYNIPVANGTFDVYLHFAETYFGAPGKKGGAGSRQFHVNMEGSRKLTNYDIFVKAGGAMRAAAETFTVNVTDGMLNIDFLTGAADLPRVSAIEVIPVSSVTLKPLADAYVRDGSYKATNFGTAVNLDVKNNASDPSASRSAYLRFPLSSASAVTSARLRIYGHNHENSKSVSVHAYGVNNDIWTENGIVKNNAPAASTPSLGYAAVNNTYKYYEIDVTSYVKAQQQSGETLVSLMLSDPNNRNIRLVFNSKEEGSYPPELIVQTSSVVNSNTRLSNEEISSNLEAEPESSSVYPNPIGKQFTVQLSTKHSEEISFDLLNNAGQSYPIATAQKARAGQKAAVDISGLSLSSGIYMLKIKSEAATEVIKLLVTE
ncbi:DNRLRE domain-containing protein [Dyadobacter flavalbus]|uniref:DNRLRE domain-containing protein n=1 Tax=Dyadobacter flavalbus TaxID=2579942 RepID=A0A5M8QZ56_9BACT|nr:ELWxxDGT repeat protein [Dyadobacter flavalbus]KAA6439302.1 DNRLRE domain-containing protein [Dyadobacter flavalbus]